MSRKANKDAPLQDKIAAAFAAVGPLPKRGRNTSKGYNYTTAPDVFAAIRQELFKRGVLLIWDEQPAEYMPIAQSNGGEQIIECRLHVKYGFEDAKSKTDLRGINGIGRDVEDKALYKAQTGAEKALLKRVGLMAEEDEDPEHDGSRETETAPAKPSKRVTERQIRLFEEACIASQRTADEISGYLLTTHQVASIAELGRGRPFTDALEWAQRMSEIHPKPEPVATQSNLPLTPAPQPVEMRIGNQTIKFEPKQTAYSV